MNKLLLMLIIIMPFPIYSMEKEILEISQDGPNKKKTEDIEDICRKTINEKFADKQFTCNIIMPILKEKIELAKSNSESSSEEIDMNKIALEAVEHALKAKALELDKTKTSQDELHTRLKSSENKTKIAMGTAIIEAIIGIVTILLVHFLGGGSENK